MISLMAIVGIIVFLGCGVFLAVGSLRDEAEQQAAGEQPKLEMPVPKAGFFMPKGGFFVPSWKDSADQVQGAEELSIELLVKDIEEHIRREELLVEAYVNEPTERRLHAGTSSRYLN